jgi:two-component system KDP operon response regulator KdpE
VPTQTILIIKDDSNAQEFIRFSLQKEGYRVLTAAEGETGLRLCYQHRPDLIILDIMMPGWDGWTTLSRLREISIAPVIMLTALTRETDIIRALNQGAVEYVTKPFRLRVFLARVQAILRHSQVLLQPPQPPVFQDEHLIINLRQRRVLVQGKQVHLSELECQVLAYLVQHHGQVVPYEQILRAVWGVGNDYQRQYAQVYVNRLRAKLEADPKRPRYLLTDYGRGYRFTMPASDP